MSLIKVYTDIGKAKPVVLTAKIIEFNRPNYTIQYLSKTNEEYKGSTVWRYEDTTYTIDDDSVTSWLETNDEFDIGYKFLPHDTSAFVYYESDQDYEPSENDDDDDGDDNDEEDDGGSLDDETYDIEEDDCAWD